jgi:hypothetical protein
MASTIPISQEVEIIPGVIGTGGNPLALNAVFLTQNSIQPSDSLLTFYSADDVGIYFGTASTEYKMASIYFSGFTNCTSFPSALYFSGFAATATSAWLLSTSLAGEPLTYFQAISGTLSITVDGTVSTASALNLSSATSIGGSEGTSVINLIKTALSWTGSNKPTITWDSLSSKFKITSNTTGATSTITYASGTTAALLGLSAGTLSQGVAAETATQAITKVKSLSSNWATFTTTWEVSNGDAVLFAQWTQTQNDKFLYVCFDSDPLAATTTPYAAGIGSILAADQFDGVIVLWASIGAQYLAAMATGVAASLNWNTLNGRATLKFRQQPGLASYVETVTTQTAANNLIANNYTYYGTYSAPGLGNIYNIVADGALAGSRFKWFDTYVGQIFLNSQLALSIFEGLLQVNLAPYTAVGDTLLRAWCADPIKQGINSGIIRSGVTLSASQIAAITYAVGFDISKNLQTYGYYLYIGTASTQVRGQRQSPPLMLYYTDGGAIQKIQLDSIVIL